MAAIRKNVGGAIVAERYGHQLAADMWPGREENRGGLPGDGGAVALQTQRHIRCVRAAARRRSPIGSSVNGL